jgi:hypothetical protein
MRSGTWRALGVETSAPLARVIGWFPLAWRAPHRPPYPPIGPLSPYVVPVSRAYACVSELRVRFPFHPAIPQ